MFGGKVPVIAGVGGSLPIALAMARQAAEAGADGILALPPYYPSPSRRRHRRVLQGDRRSRRPLGLLVYGRDWFNPGPELVARLASSIPTLIAWKDGQGDLRRYQMIRQRVGDRLYWIGGAGDDLVPGLLRHGHPDVHLQHRHGGAGAVHGAGQGGRRRATRPTLHKLMNEYVIPLYALRARKKGYEVTVMKVAMDAVGLVGGAVRPPLPPVTAQEVEEIKAMIGRWTAFLG